jgi:hypothetical protein
MRRAHGSPGDWVWRSTSHEAPTTLPARKPGSMIAPGQKCGMSPVFRTGAAVLGSPMHRAASR